jgi:Tol biopolymer transport system component/DNA-binding winged helix-turn-helix (wHTH) protein
VNVQVIRAYRAYAVVFCCAVRQGTHVKYNSASFGLGVSAVATSRPFSVRAFFGQFQLNLATGELRGRNGTPERLSQQPLQILRLLLEADGRVVSRDELRTALWPEETFVDFEHSVNTAIKKVRRALDDSVENPKFIETVPKVGYRFLVPVEWIPESQNNPPYITSTGPIRVEAAPQLQTRIRIFAARNILVIAFILASAIVVLLLYRRPLLRSKGAEPSISFPVTNVGEKYSPSLSPDGKQLAFAWNGGAGLKFSIYVKLIATEEPLRLTRQESIDFNPVWSPDGHYIVFCRIKKGYTGIYMVPTLGGAERKIRDTHWEERDFDQVFWYFGRLSWSPDGMLLAFSDRASSNEPTSIYLLSLDSLSTRRVTSPGLPGDYNPAFSPDGQTLAFNRGSQGVTSIYTVPVAGGRERKVVTGSQFGWGLAWTSDGREIVFGKAGWLARSGWLWKISAHGGEPQRLQFGQEGTEPSIRGSRLVYARQQANLNVWRKQLDSIPPTPADRFLSSTAIESGPQYSPNGRNIVFESTRSGSYEIWTCRSDGTNLEQLTHFNNVTGTPRWSPDGQQIAFDSRATGNAEIFVMDSEGSALRKLTNDPSADVVPSWSRDGRWIYFASGRSGPWEVWKMPSAGGQAVQVTRHGGYGAFEAPDGKFLYYTKYPAVPGIWRMATSGGEETQVIADVEPEFWGYWAVVERGIYYLDTTTKPAIAFFDFASGQVSRLFELETRPAREATGLAASPDGRTVLYTQLDALTRDVVLVDNFQ